jgi:hypothetical protein
VYVFKLVIIADVEQLPELIVDFTFLVWRYEILLLLCAGEDDGLPSGAMSEQISKQSTV